MTCLQDEIAAPAIDSISLSVQPSSGLQRRNVSGCEQQMSLLLRGPREKKSWLRCHPAVSLGAPRIPLTIEPLLPAGSLTASFRWVVRLTAGVPAHSAGAGGLATSAHGLFH